MPEGDYTQVVVLAEDRQQAVFARAFLGSCGINPRRIREIVAPAGAGSGEHYVRMHYPEEVAAHRRYCTHKNIALVVIIDADNLEVDKRKRQLERSLSDANLAPRTPDERIALIIPKRNIETWVHFLMGEEVDENSTYPHLDRPREAKEGVRKLAVARNQELPSDAPPSLRAACEERRRVME